MISSRLSFAAVGLFSRCTVKRNNGSFTKRFAFTRDIDETLKTAALTMNVANQKTIDLARARRQHETLTNVLKDIGLKVCNLPSDGYPDSVFIEDTCVIIDNVALITRPGAKSRQGETTRVRDYLKTIEPGVLHVKDLQEGHVDGGDVMFTGKEILVGLTTRTDEAGIRSLQKAFSDYPVRMVDMNQLKKAAAISARSSSTNDEEVLHLKSLCSMCGENTILLGGKLGKTLSYYLSIPQNNPVITNIHPTPVAVNYQYIHVPDTAAANVVYVNNTIVRRAKHEYPVSDVILRAQVDKHIRQIEVEADELAKVDGALSCCSVLY